MISTAVATDNLGASRTSSVVNVTVANPSAITTNSLVAFWERLALLRQGHGPGNRLACSGLSGRCLGSGPAQLGYGDGDESSVVSYGPDANNKYITTNFRQAFNLTEAWPTRTSR